MLIQVRVVVRTRRTRESPSTPTLYWIPKAEIQGTASTYWNPGRPGRKPTNRMRERTQVARVVARATPRMAAREPRGRRPMTIAPTRGRKMIVERMGNPVISAPSPPGEDEEGTGHEDEPDGDPQGVVLDATGLDPPQAGSGRHREPSCPVHQEPVDDPLIESLEPLGQPPAQAD